MDNRKLISADHNLHKKHGAYLIPGKILQKFSQGAPHHVIDKLVILCPWQAADHTHIFVYAVILNIIWSVVFILVHIQGFHNIIKVVDYDLKITAVRKVHILLAVQSVMLYTIPAIAYVILYKACAVKLSLEKQTPFIIAVDLIRHFVGIGVLFKLPGIIFSKHLRSPFKKLGINIFPGIPKHRIPKKIVIQLLDQLIKIKFIFI